MSSPKMKPMTFSRLLFICVLEILYTEYRSGSAVSLEYENTVSQKRKYK